MTTEASCICSQCGKYTVAVAIDKDEMEQLRKALEKIVQYTLRNVEKKFMEEPQVCLNCGLVKARKDMPYPLGADTFLCGTDCFKAYTKNTREGYA